MVCGEICDMPLGVVVPELGVTDPAGCPALLGSSNGFAAACAEPEAWPDEDFEVIDCRASSADETAPRANNMTRTPTMPRPSRLSNVTRPQVSKRHAIAKNPMKSALRAD